MAFAASDDRSMEPEVGLPELSMVWLVAQLGQDGTGASGVGAGPARGGGGRTGEGSGGRRSERGFELFQSYTFGNFFLR